MIPSKEKGIAREVMIGRYRTAVLANKLAGKPIKFTYIKRFIQYWNGSSFVLH